MLLDFNKPKKIMSEKERQEKYSSDCEVPGTYVPNMSINDMKKWKGKYIKGKDERVEIRKTVSGTQLVVIVYKEVRYEECKYSYSNETYQSLVHKNIHISANGKILLTFHEYKELLQVIEEAQMVLANPLLINEPTSPIQSERGLNLLNYLTTIPKPFKSALNSLEIDDEIFVNKITNPNGFTYAIQNKYGHTFSKIDSEFYLENSPSNRDDEYYKEFRFETIEDAIICYYSNKENNR